MGMVIAPARFSVGGGITDPSFASTVLLLGMEGANASTTFTDESHSAHGNAFIVGTAQVTTAQAKFGTGSLLLNGSSLIHYNDSADWEFGSGDFTLEAWVMFNAKTTWHTILSHYLDTTQHAWDLDYDTSGGALRFIYSGGGSSVTIISRTWAPSLNTWYHVAVDRASGTLRLYVDGAMLGANVSAAVSFWDAGTQLRVGAINNGAADTNFFNGWIDEVRITKGVARYASDAGYTVPTAAFPRS